MRFVFLNALREDVTVPLKLKAVSVVAGGEVVKLVEDYGWYRDLSSVISVYMKR